MANVRLRLERELREPEARLDVALLDRLRTPSLESYRRYLCDVYGFLVPLDNALVFSGGFDSNFLRPRLRSGLLASDLLAAGVTDTEYPLLARRLDIGRFGSRQEAIGWLYVGERVLRAHATIRGATGSRYLASFDHALWLELLDRIEALGFSPLARTHLLATIRDATNHLLAWISPSAAPRTLAAWTPDSAVSP